MQCLPPPPHPCLHRTFMNRLLASARLQSNHLIHHQHGQAPRPLPSLQIIGRSRPVKRPPSTGATAAQARAAPPTCGRRTSCANATPPTSCGVAQAPAPCRAARLPWPACQPRQPLPPALQAHPAAAPALQQRGAQHHASRLAVRPQPQWHQTTLRSAHQGPAPALPRQDASQRSQRRPQARARGCRASRRGCAAPAAC